MYRPEMFAFFVLCVVLFIGEVFYNEAFSDCSSPGALTWTITMNPGSEASMCSGGSGGSSSGGGSSDSGSGSGSSDSSGNSTKSTSSGSGSSSGGPFNLSNNVDDYYGHTHNMHHRLGAQDNDYGYSANSIEKLWRDISGSDVSGNRLNTDYNFNLSLSDLLSLVGKTIVYGDSRSVESRFQPRRDELQNPYYYDYEEYFQNCKSPSNAQAVDYMRRKNPLLWLYTSLIKTQLLV
jgi:hypothetical protein